MPFHSGPDRRERASRGRCLGLRVVSGRFRITVEVCKDKVEPGRAEAKMSIMGLEPRMGEVRARVL